MSPLLRLRLACGLGSRVCSIGWCKPAPLIACAELQTGGCEKSRDTGDRARAFETGVDKTARALWRCPGVRLKLCIDDAVDMEDKPWPVLRGELVGTVPEPGDIICDDGISGELPETVGGVT